MQVALYGRSRPVVLDLDRDVGCRAWNLSCPFEVNERAREAPVRFKQELAACPALPNAKTPIRAEAVAVLVLHKKLRFMGRLNHENRSRIQKTC